MLYLSRPDWQRRPDRTVYGVVFFEHLPTHTQTIGAMHLECGRLPGLGRGNFGANFLTSHDSIIILSVYILTSGGLLISFVRLLVSTDTQHLDFLRRLSEGGVPTFVHTVHSSSISAFT